MFASGGGAPARLRRLPRPPRRHRRRDPGRDAGVLDAARRGGRRDPAHPRRRRRAARARRADAQPRAAPRRPARPARRQPDSAPSACASSPSATAPTELAARMSEILDYAERRTRAALAGAARRRGRPPRTCSRASTATIALTVRAATQRRRAEPRLRGQRRPGRGQPQLPALGDPGGVLLRGAGGLRPRRPAVGRRLAPGRGRGARGLAPERRARPRPWSRRQRRDLEPGRRPRDRGARRLRAGPRAGPGHDEQPHALPASEWTYYETIGGGQGACPDADGPSAVHVAMSNTLNTPVEALETELPVRVRELSVRAAAAARAATAAATGSCARSRRSSRCATR